MILNHPHGTPPAAGAGGRATLDDLFRRAVARRPDAVALIDPPNRASFTDGGPRRLTYAQADRAVSALAGRLRRMGLHTDAIVGLQLANTVESVLALLAVLRAGLIAMPMPLLWRRADAVAALNRVGAHALIVMGQVGMGQVGMGQVGAVDHFGLAMQIAADIFSVRHVCGFGHNAPDGIVSLDDIYTVEKLDPVPSMERERAQHPGPGAHLAVITWDVTAEGLVPVARHHGELIAGGLAVLLEGRLAQDEAVLATLLTSSFAGLSLTVLPWLLVGGTLVLHHPFDIEALVAQRRSVRCSTVVVPGPVVQGLADEGHLAATEGFRTVLAAWRTPERLARAPTWRDAQVALVDVQVFGETGLIVARRGPSGRPAAVPFGPLAVPRGTQSAMIAGEVQQTAHGTIALRGPMVPRAAFPPGAERTTLPHVRITANGFVDTGYANQASNGTAAVAAAAPPTGVVGIGGYRFVMRQLHDAVAGVEPDSTLAAMPDAFAGQRLEGTASDRNGVAAALEQLGANPLVVGAFRNRRPAA